MTERGSYRPTYAADVEGASNIAAILEIVFGFFGLLGIGHVYTGRLLLGVVLMVAWWIYISLAAFISSLTLGIAACVFIPLGIAVPIISGIQARSYIRRTEGRGNWGKVAVVAGGGCLVVIVIVVLFVVLGVGASLLSSF